MSKNFMESHLFQLLHVHECVVVPDFGAFVLRYYPAEWQQGTMMFRPPSRRVCFQSDLKQNDGILVHYVARKEGVPFREAERMIAAEVKNWNNLLSSGHSVSLPGIGKIYRIKESSLEFFPELNSNFMRDSYGLQIIRTEPVKVVENVLEVAPVEAKVLQVVSTNWSRKILRVAAITLPLFIALQITSTSVDRIDVASKSEASMSSFVVDLDKYRAAPEKESLQLTESDFTESVDEVVDIVDEDIDEVSSLTTNQKFEIVVGAFSIRANADRHAENLKQKGVNAYVLSDNERLIRVSVGSYNSQAEAEVALVNIRKNIEHGAWVLAK